MSNELWDKLSELRKESDTIHEQMKINTELSLQDNSLEPLKENLELWHKQSKICFYALQIVSQLKKSIIKKQN